MSHLDHASALVTAMQEVAARAAFMAQKTSMRLLGVPREELVGTSAFETIHPDDRPLAYAAGAATSLGLALLVGGRVFKAMKGALGVGEWVRRGLGEAADLLGAGVVAQSWHDAPAPIKLRADWKLPPAAVADTAVRTASALDPQGARQLCLQLLARLDPAWLSNFPTTR